MRRCGNSHGNTVSPCPCNGLFHTQPNPLRMMVSGPLDHESASSAVDCTLSLGNPSTRGEKRTHNNTSVTNFYWDLLQVKHAPFQLDTSPQNCYKVARGSYNSVSNGVDPMLVRRCANCDTTSTPLWRNGPRGPKSLCNACGIRFKKEERRSSNTCTTIGGAGAPLATSEPYCSWVPLREPQKLQCISPTIGTGDDSGAGLPFLSWRLNVTDRPSFVHDFTR